MLSTSSSQSPSRYPLTGILLSAALTVFLSCKPPAKEQAAGMVPEAYALDGTPLFPPPESEASLRHRDSLLAIAQADFMRDSHDLNNIIWYGRRLAYLSRYHEAIAVFSNGMERHRNAPELLRHRGHRYITTRQFGGAIEDFIAAAEAVAGRPVEIEPDGIPNALNIPLSSLQFNIWYHLGLAYYLNGDYERAAIKYDSCMLYSTNPDLLCATTDWFYMTLMRLGRTDEAATLLDAITPELEIIENDAYHKRLLMYKGHLPPDGLIDFDALNEDNAIQIVTQGYGVANYFLMQGDTARAAALIDEILATPYWAAFGYIAAEADKYFGRL